MWEFPPLKKFPWTSSKRFKYVQFTSCFQGEVPLSFVSFTFSSENFRSYISSIISDLRTHPILESRFMSFLKICPKNNKVPAIFWSVPFRHLFTESQQLKRQNKQLRQWREFERLRDCRNSRFSIKQM